MRARIELFQLRVLSLLGASKGAIALKGGCNLRFFFGSVRRSEDMDLDVGRGLEPHVLRDTMDRLLTGPALASALRVADLEIETVSAPKQTDTTQRWKIALHARGESDRLHTKIEFSRRATNDKAVVEAVDPAVLSAHGLIPLVARHYPLGAALRQKVRALVGRSVVQARDVFDLSMLLTRAGESAGEALSPERSTLARAIERAMDVSFDDYRGQVVAFLDPAGAGAFGTREAWDALQTQVVALLERAAR
jgi:hypothetical protein